MKVTAACLVFMSLVANASDSSEFAFSLYKLLSKNEGNVFYSPFSVSSALTMAAVGAKEKTFKEMEKVLRLSKDPQGSYMGIIPQLNSEHYKLVIANRIWGSTGKEYYPEFQERLKNNYNSEFTLLDFRTEPEPSRLKINKWIEEKTEGKIKDLLPRYSVLPDTEIVITNALYFKAPWASAFSEKSTQDRDFHESNSVRKSIPFMNDTATLIFASAEQAKMVEIPYKGQELSFILIMPDSKTNIRQFEQTFTYKKFNSLYSKRGPKKIQLSMPKFKTESTFELNDNLKALGMVEAFNKKKANFEGIRKLLGDERIYISKVFHKTFIDVNEAGTEAAAATAATMMLTTGIDTTPPEPFIADHPFIYLIRHQSTGAILFMGRFSRAD